MSLREKLGNITPLPLVDLDFVSHPHDGRLLKLNSTCRKLFSSGTSCRSHYESVARGDIKDSVVACPFGFSTYPFTTGQMKLAFTGVVPYPRTGKPNESKWAKKHPDAKHSVESLRSYAKFITDTIDELAGMEKESAKKYTMAFHEIRKLNRNIKQLSERLYVAQPLPGVGELRKNLETIFKTAEMLSAQFEIIEVLADESLASLPLKTESELYRIFHKCVSMYQSNPSRITLECQHGFSPVALTCDKTFPIIPTALIENSLKYSIPSSSIHIRLEPEGEDICLIKVSNEAILDKPLDSTIFMKGTRGTDQTEGSGFGLYLAQIVAKQHKTGIEVSCIKVGEKRYECFFSIRFRLIKKA